MWEKIKSFSNNRFYRNVFTLMTGTSIAQAFPILFSPLLSRLYTPEAFGTFALFLSLATSLSVISTGRYELAILLPREEKEARHVALLAGGMVVGFSGVILFLLDLGRNSIVSILKNPEIGYWLPWVSFSILCLGFYQTLNYWANRRHLYSQIAIARVIQSGVMVGMALIWGFFRPGSKGLILGSILGQMLGVVYFVKVSMDFSQDLTSFKISELFQEAKRYIKFPTLNALHALVDILQLNGIVFLISSFFGKTTLGYYSLTMRALRSPVSLIGTSIAQVFYQRSSQAYGQGKAFYPLVQKTIRRLFFFGAPIFILLYLTAPSLFAIVFGNAWREAGVYAKLLSPWLFLNFVYSPVSQVPLILNKQGTNLLFGLGYNALIIGLVLIGYRSHNIRWAFTLMGVVLSLYLALMLLWVLLISKRETQKNDH